MDARDETAKGRIALTWGWSIAAFLCLGAVLPWLAWCFYGLRHDDSWLAGLAWAIMAGIGSGAATLAGTVCGGVALVGGRPRGLAILAFALNLIVLVASAGTLWWAFHPI